MKTDEKNSYFISVNVSDLILTPLTCAALVNEIIKNLVYQRSQIPYSFNWLESAIKRKRSSLGKKECKNINLNIEKYYKVASAAFDTLEDIMKQIKSEFLKCEDLIKEVLILFGSTPLCAKEIFIIKIPFISKGHIEENHLRSMQKQQQKILRSIFLSEDWIKAMESSIPSTNTFVLLKKIKKTEMNNTNDFFTYKENYSLPSRIKHYTVELINDKKVLSNCCSHLSIHCDSQVSQSKCNTSNTCDDNSVNECIETDLLEWYQANVVVKGFKDLFVNKISASELW
ncbi:uncharacterized protein LOC108744442 [Agrilus planipennis]|uniref:Uncharacterized protein LOC108744442 n=1 Tax=Agrilus planipennis TaxID=224129 RepID=A0A1W4XSC8_AGRPL|nr:uncharacterized protein LOC108744442 [Agrilus planipennis]